jgi:hypothetical protein
LSITASRSWWSSAAVVVRGLRVLCGVALQAHDLGHVSTRWMIQALRRRRSAPAIERRPKRLESAAFGVRPANVVFLHRHRIRPAELQDAPAGAQLSTPTARDRPDCPGHVEQTAADDRSRSVRVARQ